MKIKAIWLGSVFLVPASLFFIWLRMRTPGEAKINWRLYNHVVVVLQDKMTCLKFTGAPIGKQLTLELRQDSRGDRLVTWPENVRWPNNGYAPALSVEPGARDFFLLIRENDNNFHVLDEALNN